MQDVGWLGGDIDFCPWSEPSLLPRPVAGLLAYLHVLFCMFSQLSFSIFWVLLAFCSRCCCFFSVLTWQKERLVLLRQWALQEARERLVLAQVFIFGALRSFLRRPFLFYLVVLPLIRHCVKKKLFLPVFRLAAFSASGDYFVAT